MYSAQGIYTTASSAAQTSQQIAHINIPINTNLINDTNSNPSDNNNLQTITAGYSAVPINTILSSMTANNCPASLPNYPAMNMGESHSKVTNSAPVIVSSAIAPANSMGY